MKRIIIVGSGGIGRACGLILLRHYKEENIRLALADIDQDQCLDSISWIERGLGKSISSIEVMPINDKSLKNWNPSGDILLDCTPGACCLAVAEVAVRNQMHYANLSEHIFETKKIIKLVNGNSKGFILQTGLAPGFINIFTIKLILSFEESHPDIPIENVKMRVGALSSCVSSPSYYAFTWSPAGVSTEYLNDAEVLKDGKVQFVKPLSEREELFIEGEFFEADFTSGGSSDLPNYYQNKIKNLEYKSLRYPGHYSWINQLKKKLGNKLDAESLKWEMLNQTSFQENDRVLIYASVIGRNKLGYWIEKNKYLEVRPAQFNGVMMSAIQRTTASALAQSAELLLQDKIRGSVLQSKMPIDEFLTGTFVEEHYGTCFNDFKWQYD
ncbi:MAG: saccharopine dehydrogenase C-terminal domain-containing protein [Anditalea sp.]